MNTLSRNADRPKFLRVGYLAHHIRCLPGWSVAYQAPDPVNFADYAELADEFAGLWIRDLPMSRPTPFAYPKPTGSLRNLTLLSARDSARSRAVVGAVIEVAERSLAKTVFSARVFASPPMWRFKTHPYHKFVREAKRAIREWALAGIVRTDVLDYFPTLDAERVLRYLWDSGCDKPSTSFLVNTMLECEDLRICKGLPIGPESSAVIGSFYLAPLDTELIAAACAHHRYMDDMVYLYPAALGQERSLELLDKALGAIHLTRSIEKTRHADNPIEALDLIERFDLAYVVAYMRRIPGISIEAVKEIFDEIAGGQPIDVPAFRSCLNALGSSHDPYAVESLLRRKDLFDADPRAVSDYLTVLPRSTELGNEFSRQLDMSRPDATRLHLLRAVETHGADSSNGLAILKHGADARELPPIRAWAISAYENSTAYSPLDLLDATGDTEDSEVRRAAILTLRKSPRVGRKFGARLLSRQSAELELTSRWSLAVAV